MGSILHNASDSHGRLDGDCINGAADEHNSKNENVIIPSCQCLLVIPFKERKQPIVVSAAGYDPKSYWLSRGKVYKEQFQYDAAKHLQEEMLVEYLKSIEPFPSVLEVGCGFGRISDIILSKFWGIEEYVATDLSPDQLENARSHVKSDKISFIESDVQSLKLPSQHFDLVIAAEVLLHVPPNELFSVISKLVSLSKKHVMNIDYYEERPGKNLAAHNFLHDYESLYKSFPSVIDVRRIPIKTKIAFSALDTKQSIFHALVRHPQTC